MEGSGGDNSTIVLQGLGFGLGFQLGSLVTVKWLMVQNLDVFRFGLSLLELFLSYNRVTFKRIVRYMLKTCLTRRKVPTLYARASIKFPWTRKDLLSVVQSDWRDQIFADHQVIGVLCYILAALQNFENCNNIYFLALNRKYISINYSVNEDLQIYIVHML